MIAKEHEHGRNGRMQEAGIGDASMAPPAQHDTRNTAAPIQHTIHTPYIVGPVHCYTIECGDELVLFDTGPPTESGNRYLRRHVELDRLTHVFVTHCHVDHYGQAAWLAEHTDAVVYLPARDIEKFKNHDERLEIMHGILAGMGFGTIYLDKLYESFAATTISPPIPRKYRVAELDMPPHLGIEVAPCPGHSKSDLVYFGDDWAVTGDILLRGIFQSPLLDVDFATGGRFKNYEAYCQSIVTLFSLRDKTILPGHRNGVDGVENTIVFYVAKILRRVRHLQSTLSTSYIAAIINQVFSGMTEPFHIYIKISELAFMQDFLENPDLLRLALEEIGLFDKVAKAYYLVTQE